MKKFLDNNVLASILMLYLWISHRSQSSKELEHLREELAQTMEANREYLKQKYGTISIGNLARQLRKQSSIFHSFEILHQAFSMWRRRPFVLIGSREY